MVDTNYGRDTEVANESFEAVPGYNAGEEDQQPTVAEATQYRPQNIRITEGVFN